MNGLELLSALLKDGDLPCDESSQSHLFFYSPTLLSRLRPRKIGLCELEFHDASALCAWLVMQAVLLLVKRVSYD